MIDICPCGRTLKGSESGLCDRCRRALCGFIAWFKGVSRGI